MNPFTQHPNTVGESYLTHMGMSLGFAAELAKATCAALVHAFLPFCFERTGSTIVMRLYARMVANRVTAGSQFPGTRAPQA